MIETKTETACIFAAIFVWISINFDQDKNEDTD